MGEYVVELKNITKRFPGVVALSNMQLAVKPGEIHGLIGENGAGKSTLIKVLTGVHKPDEGEIYVNGEAFQIVFGTSYKFKPTYDKHFSEDFPDGVTVTVVACFNAQLKSSQSNQIFFSV